MAASNFATAAAEKQESESYLGGDSNVAGVGSTIAETEHPSTLQGLAPAGGRKDSTLPHIPGEFPSEDREASHVADVFSDDKAQQDSSIGGGAVGSTTAGSALHRTGSATSPDQPMIESSSLRENKTSGEDHTTRNTALAGAGTAGLEAAGSGVSAPTTSDTFTGAPTSGGPLNSHKHDPSSQQSSTITNTAAPAQHESSQLYSGQPQGEDHTTRNTALAGAGVAGLGAAGYGAYEHSKDAGPSTGSTLQPETAQQQTTQPAATQSGIAEPTAIPSTTTQSEISHPTSMRSEAAQPATLQQDPTARDSTPLTSDNKDEDHTGRNTALGAGVAGVGAAGYGAYEANKNHEAEPERKKSTMEKLKEKLGGGKPKDETSTHDTATPASQTSAGERERLAGERAGKDDDHTGRNTAIAGPGVAGAGAAAYGVHEVAKDDEAERLRQEELRRQQARVEQEKQAEKARKEQEHEAEKARKEQEKHAEKERKEREKASEKEKERVEKAHKEQEKEAKRAREEEEKRREKERATALAAEDERRRNEEAERQRFEAAERKRREEEESHLGRNTALAGAGVAGAGAAGYGVHEATRDDENDKPLASQFHEDESQRDSIAADHARDAVGGPKDAAAAVPPEIHGHQIHSSDQARASYEDPNLTPAERLHEYERLRAEREGDEYVKKPGLVYKITHSLGHKKHEEQSSHPSSLTTDHQHGQAPIGTDGTIGGHASSMERGTSMRDGAAPPPRDEEGFVTLMNPAAPPDAPHVIIRDHPEER